MNIRIILLTIICFLLTGVSFVYANDHTEVISANLSTHQVTLKEGEAVNLIASYSYIPPKGEVDIIWSSNNSKIATVKKGHVKAQHVGSTKIKVSIEGEEDYCDVIVKADNPTYVKTTQCYSKLNTYRKHSHKKTLKRNKKLEKIAKIRAKEIAETGKFSHTRPNGKSGLTLIKGNLYKGENIAMGQLTCNQVSKAWYNSKGHRHNMLKKQYKKVGIAGYKYKGIIYWVQIYSS